MGLLLVLLVLSDLFAVTFTDIHPDKPGFYEVVFGDDDKVSFAEIKLRKKAMKSGKEKVAITPTTKTAWDFRLVTGSQATPQPSTTTPPGHPGGSGVFKTVLDQQSCGGCWAFAAANVYAAASYLHTGAVPGSNNDNILSPQYLIDCPATETYGGHNYTQQACAGGYPVIAFLTIMKEGLVKESCVPFTNGAKTCPRKCTGTGSFNKIKDTGFKIVDAYNMQDDLDFLRTLVTTSGPCVAEMKVYSDLSSYQSGEVYEHKSGGDVEGHAVSIYGFGSQDGKAYWLVKNSWGETWGDHGFFKIKMGQNESGIENNFYAIYNRTGEGDWSVPLPDQTPPGSGWNGQVDCSTFVGKGSCQAEGDCIWKEDTAASTGTSGRIQTHRKVTEEKARKTVRRSSSHHMMNEDPTCFDIQTSDACSNNSSCYWYDYSDEYAFCDDKNYVCGWLGNDCKSYDFAYGLHCKFDSENKCVVNPSSTNCYLGAFNSGDAKYQSNYNPFDSDDCTSATGCQWYPGVAGSSDPFCDDAGFKCEWLGSDCLNYGEDYGFVGDNKCGYDDNDNCKATGGNNCYLDFTTKGDCNGHTGCFWYNFEKDNDGFCDTANLVCSDFDRVSCVETRAWGLNCSAVGENCVDQDAPGHCVSKDRASKTLIIPTLMLVMFLFMIFW